MKRGVMGQALYRKYRSRSFDEIVGQKSVVTALQNAVKQDKISHAYLFTGPRGVGKTSIARIFAYAINGAPYTTDELPIDIIEIDAASNRGIDEVRDLREKVRIAPVSAKHKVYIIDEVHMLTTHAFNALLKTLEEPPAHIVFILATTESHKLPETITSRTQRYNFSLATTTQVTAHLKEISKKENINIDTESLQLIAKHSGGSMRDALSLLDHVRHTASDITITDVEDSIGIPPEKVVDDIISAIANNDPKAILTIIKSSQESNSNVVAIANSIVSNLILSIQENSLNMPLDTATRLLAGLSVVDSSSHPETQLQIVLLGALSPAETPQKIKMQAKVIQPAPSIATEESEEKPVQSSVKKDSTPSPVATKQVPIKPESALSSKELVQPVTPTKSGNLSEEVWQEILEDLRATHNTLYSVLRMAIVDLEQMAQKTLVLHFRFSFHLKRINESKNKLIIQEKLAKHGFTDIDITCEQSEKSKKETPVAMSKAIEEKPAASDQVLHQIRGVFGGAEALE